MTIPNRDRGSRVGVAAVAAGNLVPVAGVLWWGWRPYELVALYWLEVGIVGALSVFRIPLLIDNAAPNSPTEDGEEGTGPSLRDTLLATGGFVWIYLVFWGVHGMLVSGVAATFDWGSGAVWEVTGPIHVGALSLFAGHLLELIVDYGRHRAGQIEDMAAGFRESVSRLLVSNVAVLVGVLAVVVVGSPLSLLLGVVLLKTGIDVGSRLLADGGGGQSDDRSDGANERDATRTEPGAPTEPPE